jgi:hypothetical protein
MIMVVLKKKDMPTKEQLGFLKEVLPDFHIPVGLTRNAVDDIMRYLGY